MISDEVIEKVLEKIQEDNRKIIKARERVIDKWDIAEEYLGRPGRMLSGSKTAPKGKRVVWNANVCTRENGKIWFGDLNVTDSLDKLIELSIRLNTTVYVLYEMDARFDNELNPKFGDAVVAVNEYETEWDGR